MKTFSAVRYIDPGHSWVKVKRSVLHRLGIAYKVSPYSYQRNDYVYLEVAAEEKGIFVTSVVITCPELP